jgi:hypothetical protein
MYLRASSRFLSLVALPAFALTACGPLVIHTQVTSQTTIEGDSSPLGALLDQFPGFAQFASMDFSTNQDLVNQGVTKENISSVTVTDVTLTIRSPQSQDFDFLDSLGFSAQAEGMTAKPVASRTGISALGLEAPNPTLALEVTGEELVDIVTAPEMSIQVDGSGRLPREDTQIDAVVRLRVEAHL